GAGGAGRAGHCRPARRRYRGRAGTGAGRWMMPAFNRNRLRWVAIASALVVLAVLAVAVASVARTGADLPRVREFATPKAQPPLSSPLQPVSHWAQAFLDTLDDELRTSSELSTSGDSSAQYQLS